MVNHSSNLKQNQQQKTQHPTPSTQHNQNPKPTTKLISYFANPFPGRGKSHPLIRKLFIQSISRTSLAHGV